MNAPAARSPDALALAKGVVIEPDRLAAIVQQEATILGHLLIDPMTMAECLSLVPEDFAVDQHRRMFAAMRDIGAGYTARAVHERAGVSWETVKGAMLQATTLIALPDHVADIRRAAIVRGMLADAQAVGGAGAGASVRDLAGKLRTAADRAEALEARGTDLDADGLSSALSDHMRALRDGSAPLGVTTGLRNLDEVVGGWMPGELIIVAARPGMGKTVFMVTSALATAAEGEASVGLFSLEVGAQQFAARMHADMILRRRNERVPFGLFLRRAELRPETEEALADASHALRCLGLYASFREEIDVGGIESTIERWRRKADRAGRPLRVVFIDYLKFIRASDRYKGNRVLEIGETTKALRQVGKRQGVCIVLLTQLNRGVETREDKRPGLADLRDSGEIEQDADVVLMLYREAYYLRNARSAEDLHKLDMVANQVEILVPKNRRGSPGTITLWCDVSTSSMRDMSSEV